MGKHSGHSARMNSPKTYLQKCTALFGQEEVGRYLGRNARTVRRWEAQGVPAMAVSRLRDMLRGHDPFRNPEPFPSDGDRSFRFIDLFAGIGGTRLGFERVGGQCVFTSEWDKFAVQTYRTNFEDRHEIAGDITQVPADEIPQHDILVAGFPCQPFSLAGVSKKNSLGRQHGFLDEAQGTLFFDIARILDQQRPSAFLLENVKNLAGHDRGRTLEVILGTLENDLGYQVHTRIIDAKGLVPQHRERFYLVGFRDPKPFRWNRVAVPAADSGPPLRTILHQPGDEPEPPYTESFRGRTRVDPRYTLSDKLWTYLQEYAEKHRSAGNGFGCSVVGPDETTRTLSARYHKDGSEILVRQGNNRNPRRLTPRECARLMGFPDGFRIPVSDTQAYRQFGNSVVVPVIEKIAAAMVAALRGEVSEEDGIHSAPDLYRQLGLPLRKAAV